MPYWGNGPDESDYAFDAVGAYVFLIKERMFRDAETVINKSYPEQGIVASLACLRLLAVQFDKCVDTHFGRKDFEKARDAFDRWYESVEHTLPKTRRAAIRATANSEFQLFEDQVLAQK